MKVAAIVLTIIGMCANFLYSWILGLIGVVVGIAMLCSLSHNKKMVWLGVLGILFAGQLGGIFYLCWNPNNEQQTK